MSIYQLDEINFTDPVVDVNSCLDLDSLIAKFPKGLTLKLIMACITQDKGSYVRVRLPRQFKNSFILLSDRWIYCFPTFVPRRSTFGWLDIYSISDRWAFCLTNFNTFLAVVVSFVVFACKYLFRQAFIYTSNLSFYTSKLLLSKVQIYNYFDVTTNEYTGECDHYTCIYRLKEGGKWDGCRLNEKFGYATSSCGIIFFLSVQSQSVQVIFVLSREVWIWGRRIPKNKLQNI